MQLPFIIKSCLAWQLIALVDTPQLVSTVFVELMYLRILFICASRIVHRVSRGVLRRVLHTWHHATAGG